MIFTWSTYIVNVKKMEEIDNMESYDEHVVKCAVMDCRKVIKTGDTYFLLGGGTVINCEKCACFNKGKFGERGWHN